MLRLKKLNLCIDIDGTITDPYYWIKRTNEYFKTTIKPKDVTRYDIHEVLGIKVEDYLNFYNQYKELIHSESKARRGVTQVINRLYRHHQIHFVTAREPGLEKVSVEWLKKYNIPIDTISLLGTHNKVEKAFELKCDIFMEDRYENAVQLSEAGFKVFLLDCNYNKGILNEKIIRVNNWYQIEQYIIELSNEYEEKMVSSL